MRAELTFMGACVATYLIVGFAIGVVSGFRAYRNQDVDHPHSEFPNALAAAACLLLAGFAAWQSFSVSVVLLICAYATFAVRSYARLHEEREHSQEEKP